MNKFYKIILFLVPLLFFVPCFNVHAEELEQEQETSISDIYDYDFSVYPFWTIQGYQNSVIYDSNVETFNNWVSPASESLINSLDVSDYSEYPYFCILQVETNSNLFVFLFYKDGSLVISSNNKSGLFGSSDYFYVVANVSQGGVLTIDSSQSEYGSGDIIFTSRNNNRFVCSNNDVYGTVGIWSDVNTLPESTYKNFNYVIYDENGNLNYNNPILNNDSSGEDATNNMFLENSKWSFNNIPVLDNVYLDDIQKNLGTISFTAQLTDYQLQHLNDFSIQFNFDTYLKLRFVNNDGTQTFTNQTFNIHKTISLSEFYNNGLTDSNLVSNIWNGWFSTGNGNLTLNNYLSSLDQSDMFSPVVFQTQCKATLIHNEDSSGNLTTAYNYLNGASQTSDSGLGINPNPYNNDYDGFFDDQFNNDNEKGSNTTTNNGDGNIVNNNNPQITINNNNNNSFTDDGDSNGLLTKILLLLANNQSASSEGLAEIADTSGYVEVLGATFTAVPTNWWTVLTAAFIASIGIIVVSFVLKVILNFVT